MKYFSWLSLVVVAMALPIVAAMWKSLGSDGIKIGLVFSLILPFCVAVVWGAWQLSRVTIVGRFISAYFKTIERFTGIPVGDWGKLFESKEPESAPNGRVK